MKVMRIVLLGLTPFLFGNIMNEILEWAVMRYFYYEPLPSGTFEIIGLLTLVMWGWFAYYSRKHAHSTLQTIVLLNFAALAVLVFIGIQIYLLDGFLINAIAMKIRAFYLPLFRFGVMLTIWQTTSMFSYYFMAFALLVLASYIGCKLYQRKVKEIND